MAKSGSLAADASRLASLRFSYVLEAWKYAAWAAFSLTCLSGCSYLKQQTAATGLNSCIASQCEAEQGAAREQCTRSCYRQYGR